MDINASHVPPPVCSNTLFATLPIQMPMRIKVTANTSVPYSWSLELFPDLYDSYALKHPSTPSTAKETGIR